MAWESGPTVPEVWEEYSVFGAASIPSRGTVGKRYYIFDEDITTINELVDHLEQYSTVQLTRITQHQTPWKKGRYWSRDWVIKLEWIKEFFEEE